MNEFDKNIFITGGSGFMGRHFLKAMEKSDYKCFVLTRDSSRVEKLNNKAIVEILQGDLTDIGKFQVQLNQCAYFIHMAGEKSNEDKMHSTNVKALKIILNSLLPFPQIRFMYLSSTGVYGIWNHPEVMLTEDLPCFPENLYERTKLEAEEMISTFSSKHDFRFIILRPSNVFGEEDNSKKLLKLIQTIKRGLFFEVDKHCMVNYVYVSYVTEVMMAILRKDLFDNGIYNVNSPISLTKFTGFIKAGLGKGRNNLKLPGLPVAAIANLLEMLPARFRFIDKTKFAALVNKKIYPSEKLEKVLNLDGIFALQTGIKNLIEYYRRNKWI